MSSDEFDPPYDSCDAAMVAAVPGFGLSKLVEYAHAWWTE